MSITWDAADGVLHLRNEAISYLMQVHAGGALGQLHFGAPVAADGSYRHLSPTAFTGFSNRLGESVLLEYPTGASGDYRIPALVVRLADGSGVLDLRYQAHRILAGKPPLPGLPATYVEDDAEATTAEILLVDEPTGLEARLAYSIFRDVPVVARSVRFRNGGSAPIELHCAMSASLDLPDAGWEMLHLSGTWARERHVVRRRLAAGRQSISSRQGASSAQHNPFLALLRPKTTEEAGEAIGLSFVYSGNFLAEVEVDAQATARVRLGIDPEDFTWRLEPGEAFVTPEALICHSTSGLGGLSEAFHRLFRERLARGVWRDRPRPIVLNSWEATYHDVREERLLEIAAAGRDLGIELFVLDDGWFGARDDDTTSLGDWQADTRKLPDGLGATAERIAGLGIGFGIWVEPEMVSRRSQLFEARPDWSIGVPGRPQTEGRDQLVLDLSRAEVVDHLHEVIGAVIASGPIGYVKWDMNRYITEAFGRGLPPERQGEFFHRYMLGLYDLLGRLTADFPDVLFESCASGGGRFDPGMLAFAPQAWTSDDTDAIERLRIQWGTSMAYPLSSMAAHVSAVPNHQVGRVTPIATRAAVAFFGPFGYELDPTRLPADERAAVTEQVAFYREHRDLFQRGRFLRLMSPFEADGNEVAWMVVADDGRGAIAAHYRVLSRSVPGPARLRLRGLDPGTRYAVSTWPLVGDSIERTNTGMRGGDELMHVGLILDMERDEAPARGDFQARLFVLEAVEGA